MKELIKNIKESTISNDTLRLNSYYMLIAYLDGDSIDVAKCLADKEVKLQNEKYSVVVFAKNRSGDVEEVYEIYKSNNNL